ncbi:hypothetical protein LEN26_008527 [Aphanomyces euteiches]|nr:hypothetical protein AeMF1_009595 [Aphanomyces euteiches]KAH9130438.1 hypothetical protein LEN26_008527 [Aphanomyces euteiches]KAH9198000.1 hypothetical protein AeNC1_000007 [Aphanomyces euteiches]
MGVVKLLLGFCILLGSTVDPLQANPATLPLNNHVRRVLLEDDPAINARASITSAPATHVVEDNDLDLLRRPQRKVHVLSGIAAALSIVAGIPLIVMGHKLLRISALICGIAIGGIFFYMVGTGLWSSPVVGAWILLLVGGLVFGVVCFLAVQVGDFIVGASGGMSLAILIHISFGYFCWPSNPNASLCLWAAPLTIILGLLSVLVGKPILIVSTSFAGGLMSIWGIGYFTGRYPCVIDLPREFDSIQGSWHYSIPSAWWGYLTATLVMAIAGIGLQFVVTGVDETKKKHEDPHHQTHKKGHPELKGHHSRIEEIEMVERSHHLDRLHNHHGSISIEDEAEYHPHRYSEEMEPVKETTYVQVGTPRNMHDHRHQHHR